MTAVSYAPEALYADACRLIDNGYVLAPVDANKKPMITFAEDGAGVRDHQGVAAWVNHGAAGFAILARHSGVDIIDLDVDPADAKDGVTWWHAQGLPVSPMAVTTPRGGRHYYWHGRPDAPFSQSNGKIFKGVDTRSATTNGYAIAVGHGRTIEGLCPAAHLPPTPDAVVSLIPGEAHRAPGNPGEPLSIRREDAIVGMNESWARLMATPRGAGLRDAILSWAGQAARYALAEGGAVVGLADKMHGLLEQHADWGHPAWNTAVSEEAVRDAVAYAVAEPWVWRAKDAVDYLAEQHAAEQAAKQTAYAAQQNIAEEAVIPPLPLFDPGTTQDDQSIAEAVLMHVADRRRYAGGDVGTWLIREPRAWRMHTMNGRTLVAETARNMVRGNPEAALKAKAAQKSDLEVPADVALDAARWNTYQRFRKSGTAAAVGSVLDALVQSPEVGGSLKIGDLDADGTILWGGGLPWDLTTGARADLDPATIHLNTALCAPNPAVPTPRWDAFLTAVWPDATTREYAMYVLSTCLIGGSFKMMPVLFGERDRGKSTVLELLMVLLDSYAWEFPAGILTGRQQHNQAKFDLRGRRLAAMDEGLRDSELYLNELKRYTGTAPIVADPKGKAAAQFPITYTLVVAQNPDPDVRDPAVRSRIRALPCDGDPNQVIPAVAALRARQDKGFKEEAPGVLADLMRRAQAFIQDQSIASKDAAPAVLRERENEIADEQDTVLAWVKECTEPNEPGTLSRELHQEYLRWYKTQQDAGIIRRYSMPESSNAFGRALTGLGFPSVTARHPVTREPAKMRHLVTKREGFAHTTPPAPSEWMAATPSVTGPVTTPVTHESPGQAPTVSPVTDVPSTSSRELENINNKYIEAIGDGPETRNIGSTPTSEAPSKPTRSEKAAAARAAKVEEASGPYVGLPALVRRGEGPVPVTLEEARTEIFTAMERVGRLTTDVESTGYPIGHALYGVRTIQLGDFRATVVLDANDPDHRALAGEALNAAPEVVAHNQVADLAPLAWLGVVDYETTLAKTTDTAVWSKLADPASGGGEPGLKDAAPAVLGEHAVVPAADAARKKLFQAGRWLEQTEAETPIERSGWAQVDYTRATMITYAASDVLDCDGLRAVLPAPDPALAARERAVARVAARPAYIGIKLDAAAVDEQLATREPVAQREREAVQSFGVDNPGSPKQLKEGFAALGTPVASTTKETLAPLAKGVGPAADLAGRVLAWRTEDKLLSTYVRPWKLQTTEGDGRVRPTIYTLGADTGRMSSARPNCQNIPRKGGMRECWIADEGWLWVGADFSSVEVRVAAAVSGDPLLRELVMVGDANLTRYGQEEFDKLPARERGDLHGIIATEIWGPDYTSEQRTVVKRGVFGRLYGGGIDTLATQVGVDHPTMQRVIDMLDRLTPVLKRWSSEISMAAQQGRTLYPTYSGRTIYLPRKTPHAAPNYVIQGTARELFVDAMLRWEASPYGGGIVIPVHDEIVAMVRAEVAGEALNHLRECMTAELAGIPISAEPWDEPTVRWHK